MQTPELLAWVPEGFGSSVVKIFIRTASDSAPLLIQVLKKIAKFIQEQNDKIYAPRGLLLTDPIERGLRVVSFGPAPSLLTACSCSMVQ